MIVELQEGFKIVLFVLLLVAQIYCLGKLFSYIDAELFSKYRLLGPFALAIPGVLKPGGIQVLLALVLATSCVFAFGLYLFQFDGFPSSANH